MPFHPSDCKLMAKKQPNASEAERSEKSLILFFLAQFAKDKEYIGLINWYNYELYVLEFIPIFYFLFIVSYFQVFCCFIVFSISVNVSKRLRHGTSGFVCAVRNPFF